MVRVVFAWMLYFVASSKRWRAIVMDNFHVDRFVDRQAKNLSSLSFQASYLRMKYLSQLNEKEGVEWTKVRAKWELRGSFTFLPFLFLLFLFLLQLRNNLTFFKIISRIYLLNNFNILYHLPTNFNILIHLLSNFNILIHLLSNFNILIYFLRYFNILIHFTRMPLFKKWNELWNYFLFSCN